MKKLSIITLSLSLLSAVLVSGCGGKDAPFVVDAGGHTESSGDATVVPGRNETISEGTPGSSDETILPTGTAPDVVEETPPSPAPSAPTPPADEHPAVADGDGVADDSPDIETPPLPSATIPFPAPEGIIPLPGVVLRIRVGVQHDQDVTHLMNVESPSRDRLQSDEFTTYETQVQDRIVAERVALGEDLGIQLKNYVVEVLRKGIDSEHRGAEVFNQGVTELGQDIAAFKSGDLTRSLNAARNGVLSRPELGDAVSRHPDLLKQAGAYLEIQFAEAYKDIAKASFQANGEVSQYSTLVWGGDAFDLVYKPNGFLDQGFNHIRGLSDADIWHEGTNNWRAVAAGIRSALNAARPVDPAAAAAAAREIEEAVRSLREQGERINDSIMRW